MTILEEIAESRRQDIPNLKRIIEEFRDQTVAPDQHTRKKLSEIFNENPRIGIISELKVKSPASGLLLNSQNVPVQLSFNDIMVPTCNNIQNIIDQMVTGGVYGISIITEPRYFMGSFGNLFQACKRVPRTIPVLLKDFVIDESQIELGAICGASNGLIIPSICEPLKIIKSMEKHGIEPLIELHDEDDLRIAIDLKNAGFNFVIGVNNRNLKDLSIDLSITRKLVPEIRKRFGSNQSIITESGISHRVEMIEMSRNGINAALIGTSIISSNISNKIYELLFGTKPFVKICGITNEQIFEKVDFNGVSAIGVILNVPKSIRNISIEKAKLIFAKCPPYLQRVIVTKDKSLDEIMKYNEFLNPDLIQCNINELITNPKAVPSIIRGKLLYSIRLSEFGVSKTIQLIKSLPEDIFGIILDSSEGEGTLLDISSVKEVISSCNNVRIVIAGGISSRNIIDIYEKAYPFGIDASSSLEKIKGIKDPEMIFEFVEKIKQITTKISKNN